MAKKKNKKSRAQTQQKKTKKKVRQKSLLKDRNFISIASLILIIILIAFIPTLSNDFVNWDDPSYVTQNIFIQEINAQNLKILFTKSLAANYHPLTFISLAIDYAIGNGGPRAFHITNLAIHLLNSLLVFLLVYRLFKEKLIIAIVSALLFGIHPMHVESVAWITERKDVLYTFFFLLGLIAYLQFLRKEKFGGLLLVLALYTLSLLSKPAAVTFPLVLLLLDHFFKRGFGRKVLLEKVPFFILAILFSLITIQIQSDTAVKGIEEISILERMLYAPYGFNIYLIKFLIPFKLSTFYPYPNMGTLPSYFYLMPFLALSVLASVYFFFRKNTIIVFGVLFFVLTISITLQLFSFGGAILSERYTYLPYIGLSICLGYLIYYLSNEFHLRRNLIYGLFSLYVLFLAGSTWQQSKVWKNSETLWTQVIENATFVTNVGYGNRAKYYKTIGELDKAKSDYEKALSIRADDPEVKLGMGNLLLEKREFSQAIEYYNDILRKDPNNKGALNSRGMTYAQTGNSALAMQDFNKLVSLYPLYVNGYKNRGLNYLQSGQYENARIDFLECLKYSPNDVDLLNAVGVCYQNLNQHQQAIDYFNRSIQRDPNSGNWYFNRGNSYNAIRNTIQAKSDWQKAASLGFPIDPNLLRG